MQHEWILDVLTDLKTFAVTNDLGALAAQLDKTQLVAVSEIEAASGRMGLVAHGDDASTGTYPGRARAGARA